MRMSAIPIYNIHYTSYECHCNYQFFNLRICFAYVYEINIIYAYLPFYRFHLLIVVSIDGGFACISRIPNRRGLSLGCDISVRGLPYSTRKRTGAVDHG